MKKYTLQCFIFLPLLLASFFFCTFVYADTISYEITDTNFDLLITEKFTLLKNHMDSLNTPYYVTYFPGSGYLAAVTSSGFIPIMHNNLLKINPYPYSCNGSGRCTRYVINNNNVISIDKSIGGNSEFYSTIFSSDSTYHMLYLYSNFDLSTSGVSITNTYTITYDDYSFTVGPNSDIIIPTLYDIYQELHNTPIDNTPFLTNFYTTIGSKISWLGEQLVSNYIYLSIFGIFILIFIINFIRRFLL